MNKTNSNKIDIRIIVFDYFSCFIEFCEEEKTKA